MENILLPKDISISQILSNKKNLSANNYKKIAIKNINVVKLAELLNKDNPYQKGIETGSSLYLSNLKSSVNYIRNSCLDNINYITQNNKSLYLNDKKLVDIEKFMLSEQDILLSVDANIGDVSLFLSDNQNDYIFSSGLMRLNISYDINKYYLFAFLKDEYFRKQLDAMTPKGSTIRHSGNRFLECLIPIPKDNETWVIECIENLIKNLVFSEFQAIHNQREIYTIFDNILDTVNISSRNPNVSDLFDKYRLDAGIYSTDVQEFFDKISKFPTGSLNLNELGYITKRGPNLAKRDIGRSIKTSTYAPNYAMLVYPSDISEFGLVNKSTFLGTKGKIWYLQKDDILFSAEGNVGKTFAICDNSWKFTTNFHGIIITPTTNEHSMQNTILITTFLNYMKHKGIMDKISVGGQGGSLAVQYWDIIKFPNISNDSLSEISKLYYSGQSINPFEFDSEKIKHLGIYEISNLRVLCKSLLDTILSDIKNDTLKDKGYYLSILND